MVENISIIDFPNEILYRICDYLDTKTIILSFGYVCKHLNLIINNYNRYKINLNNLSKSELNIYSKIIKSENIISIHFWSFYLNDLFLSLFNLNKLNRINLITISNIEQSQLKIILSFINKISNIKSFSIYSSILINDDQILNYLNQILNQDTLRYIRLMFDISCYDKLYLSSKSYLENINLTICNIKQFKSIIDNCFNLNQLSLYDCKINLIKINLNSINKLTYLRFNNIKISFDQFQLILISTPYLKYLYLTSLKVSYQFVNRLSKWENFLKNNLYYLSKFEFNLTCENFNVNNIESLIDSFRKPFWLIEKDWKITIEYQCWYPLTELIISSLSSSSIDFPDQCNYKTIFCSTSTTINHWNIYLTANHNALLFYTEWVFFLLLNFKIKISF